MTSSPEASVPKRVAALPGPGAVALFLGIGWSLGVVPLTAAGVIAAHFESPSAFAAVWLVAIAYAVVSAVVLAGSATREGGYYAVVREGLGDCAACSAGWGEWIAICAATAAAAVLIGDYGLGLLPGARAGEVLALTLVGVVTVVAWSARRAGSILQIALGGLSVAALVAFGAGALWLGSRSPSDAAVISTERDGSFFIALALAAQAGVIAMSGFAAPLYAGAGEGARKRTRAAVIALVIGAIHAIVAVTVLRVVSLATIAGSTMALETAAERLFGAASYDGVRALLIIVLSSAVSAGALMAPRILAAMAEDGLFWRGALPAGDAALLLSSAMVAALVITSAFRPLLPFVAVLLLATQLIALAAVARGRASRFVRVAAGVNGTAALLMLAALIASSPSRALALLVYAAALPACLVVRRTASRVAARAAFAVKSGSGSRSD